MRIVCSTRVRPARAATLDCRQRNYVGPEGGGRHATIFNHALRTYEDEVRLRQRIALCTSCQFYLRQYCTPANHGPPLGLKQKRNRALSRNSTWDRCNSATDRFGRGARTRGLRLSAGVVIAVYLSRIKVASLKEITR